MKPQTLSPGRKYPFVLTFAHLGHETSLKIDSEIPEKKEWWRSSTNRKASLVTSIMSCSTRIQALFALLAAKAYRGGLEVR